VEDLFRGLAARRAARIGDAGGKRTRYVHYESCRSWPDSEVAERPDEFRFLGHSGLVVLTANLSDSVQGFGVRRETGKE
jgi:hypothetical protein